LGEFFDDACPQRAAAVSSYALLLADRVRVGEIEQHQRALFRGLVGLLARVLVLLLDRVGSSRLRSARMAPCVAERTAPEIARNR